MEVKKWMNDKEIKEWRKGIEERMAKREKKDNKKEKKGEGDRKESEREKKKVEESETNKGEACRRCLHVNNGHHYYSYSWWLQPKYDFKTIQIKTAIKLWLSYFKLLTYLWSWALPEKLPFVEPLILN
jgi:hypothetical protein